MRVGSNSGINNLQNSDNTTTNVVAGPTINKSNSSELSVLKHKIKEMRDKHELQINTSQLGEPLEDHSSDANFIRGRILEPVNAGRGLDPEPERSPEDYYA